MCWVKLYEFEHDVYEVFKNSTVPVHRSYNTAKLTKATEELKGHNKTT